MTYLYLFFILHNMQSCEHDGLPQPDYLMVANPLFSFLTLKLALCKMSLLFFSMFKFQIFG
jgi:hypothetical protein